MISNDTYPCLAFSHLTCHPDDTGIGDVYCAWKCDPTAGVVSFQ